MIKIYSKLFVLPSIRNIAQEQLVTTLTRLFLTDTCQADVRPFTSSLFSSLLLLHLFEFKWIGVCVRVGTRNPFLATLPQSDLKKRKYFHFWVLSLASFSGEGCIMLIFFLYSFQPDPLNPESNSMDVKQCRHTSQLWVRLFTMSEWRVAQ